MTREIKDDIIYYLVEYIKIVEKENEKLTNELIQVLRDAKKELVERGVLENSSIITKINGIIYGKCGR